MRSESVLVFCTVGKIILVDLPLKQKINGNYAFILLPLVYYQIYKYFHYYFIHNHWTCWLYKNKNKSCEIRTRRPVSNFSFFFFFFFFFYVLNGFKYFQEKKKRVKITRKSLLNAFYSLIAISCPEYFFVKYGILSYNLHNKLVTLAIFTNEGQIVQLVSSFKVSKFISPSYMEHVKHRKCNLTNNI